MIAELIITNLKKKWINVQLLTIFLYCIYIVIYEIKKFII